MCSFRRMPRGGHEAFSLCGGPSGYPAAPAGAPAAGPTCWNQHPIRTTFPGTPHDVNDILLRFNSVHEYEATGDPASIVDGHESINFPAFAALPQARPLIFGLMARVEGERLGRCIITELLPGHQITPHIDSGAHAAYYRPLSAESPVPARSAHTGGGGDCAYAGRQLLFL